MVAKIFPSSADYENLSRVKTQVNAEANIYDYTQCVVNKPWGYEYLWYQDAHVAIWFLHIDYLKSTSLHCHVKKRTSLLLLQGKAVSSTLENRYKLSPGDAVVLEACVFHSTTAISEGGIYVLEVETPPMKGDLVRLKDAFGRQGAGYESSRQYSQDFSQYLYVPFYRRSGGAPIALGTLFLDVVELHSAELLSSKIQSAELIVPLNRSLSIHPERKIAIGEAFNPSIFDWDRSTVESMAETIRVLVITDLSLQADGATN
ncbi:MAG: hypothetical protein NZM04_03145 [Methylacidiphilales bacterium]|nr:hypothetical protein [Candidatus Methylacidiphilales bacterium]MDW8348729.1 hypothetical protein [Verrucomicrobiae bacterium]